MPDRDPTPENDMSACRHAHPGGDSTLARHRDGLAVLGEKVSVVSHELRGPLSTAMNSLFLVRHELGAAAPAVVEHHLAAAERQLARAAALVEQVLELSRPRVPQISTLKLGEVLAEVFEVLPPPPGVDVLRTGEFVVAQADRVQLVELVGNLVANAYDAMPRGGSLLVDASRAGDDIVLTVEDTGVGFDPGQARRLLEPFVTTKPGGTGLGLAIVQRAAAAHGGDVRLRATVGGGTMATVRLPHAAVAPGAPAR